MPEDYLTWLRRTVFMAGPGPDERARERAAEFEAWLDERDAQVKANAIVEAAEVADRLLVLDSYCDTPSIEEIVQPDDPRFAMTVSWAIPATTPVESFGSWLREWGDRNSLERTDVGAGE